MNDPPPFIPPDLRVSPSGPYIAGPELGGAIVQFGSDAVVGPFDSQGSPLLVLTETVAPPAWAFVDRLGFPAPVPLAVTFLEWQSTDYLWINWHFSGLGLGGSGDDPEAAIQFNVQPTIDLGDGNGPQVIDPSGVGGTYLTKDIIAIEFSGTDPINLAGHAVIRITNPTQPPIVQLAYSLVGLVNAGATITSAGKLGNDPALPSPFSAWLCCAELDTARVFQQPAEPALTPLA